MPPRKAKAPATPRSNVTFEFNVLDEDAKMRVARCIERNGKVTVSMILKGRVPGGTDGGFEQKVD